MADPLPFPHNNSNNSNTNNVVEAAFVLQTTSMTMIRPPAAYAAENDETMMDAVAMTGSNSSRASNSSSTCRINSTTAAATAPTSTRDRDRHYGWRMVHRRPIDDESLDLKANACWDDVRFVVANDDDDDNNDMTEPTAAATTTKSALSHTYSTNVLDSSTTIKAPTSLIRKLPYGTNNMSENLCNSLGQTKQHVGTTNTAASTSGSTSMLATSSKLRNLLRADLSLPTQQQQQQQQKQKKQRIGNRTDVISNNNTSSSSPRRGSAYTSPTSGTIRRKLKDQYGADIQMLLRSLRSTEFVGTIDPRYHSQYVVGGGPV